MTAKGAELTLPRGFAGPSPLWLPPVIPGKVDLITTRLAVSDDLFLTELMGT